MNSKTKFFIKGVVLLFAASIASVMLIFFVFIAPCRAMPILTYHSISAE